MKHPKLFALAVTLFSLVSFCCSEAAAINKIRTPKFRHVDSRRIRTVVPQDSLDMRIPGFARRCDELADSLYRNTLLSLDSVYLPSQAGINKVFAPWVFSGYRSLSQRDSIVIPPLVKPLPSRFDIEVFTTPAWLRQIFTADRIQEEFIYKNMIRDYRLVDYAYWDLPVPPRLPEDDYSFAGYLKKLQIPVDDRPVAIEKESDIDRRHWLHKFNPSLQFSQAYISNNWYQGGTSSLSLLVNFLWDVNLNTVYHPNLLFQSTVSYKLGVTSTPKGSLHKLLISDDIFQYNLKAGFKAFHNWFYSFTTQFKTQFFQNYPSDSNTRTASFLSPGDLNLGLGMTYSKQNASGKLKFSASIAPISYNLKTCIDPLVDHAQFNIKPNRKTHTDIGSNAEINFTAAITGNISYTTRLFLFTSYKEFQGDWENTFAFRINSFLTTQIYAHLRYDSSSDASNTTWRHWMLKELLSFGLSYYFQTGK